MVNDGHLKLFITCSYSPNSPKWRNWWFCSPGTWGNLGCERVRRTQCQCFPNCFLQYPLVFSRSYSHIYNINSWFSHQKWWFPIAKHFLYVYQRVNPAAARNLVPVPCDDDGILPSELAPLLPGAKVLQPGDGWLQSQSQRSLWSLGFFSNEWNDMTWNDMTWMTWIFMMQNQWDVILYKISICNSPQNIWISVWSAYDGCRGFLRYTVPVGHNPLGTRMAPERYQAGLWPVHLGQKKMTMITGWAALLLAEKWLKSQSHSHWFKGKSTGNHGFYD